MYIIGGARANHLENMRIPEWYCNVTYEIVEGSASLLLPLCFIFEVSSEIPS